MRAEQTPREGEETESESGADTGMLPVSRRTLLKVMGAGVIVPIVEHDLNNMKNSRATASGADDPWTIVALPDTQFYAETPNLISYARAQTQWVVDNLASRNIRFVTHEGDIVENAAVESEWIRISDALSTLDGRVPYSTLPGNHDWAVNFDRNSSTKNYQKYFGASRYRDYDWFGGSSPNGLNSYQLFSAGGYDFLHLGLEWEVPGSIDDPSTPLGWAQTVLDQYPNRPTIITTHSYLVDGTPGGRTRYVEEQAGEGNSAEAVWQTLVSPNPQVFMVLNGHFTENETRSNERGEYHLVSRNEANLPVYQLVADYQDEPNGGNGWLRLIEFRPGKGIDDRDRIRVRTYSPRLDTYATDVSSQFSFDLRFDDRFTQFNGSTAPERCTFQQGQNGYVGTVDTYLPENDPDDTNAAETRLFVDADDPTGTGDQIQTLLRFDDVVGDDDGQIPPGATVTDATLVVGTNNQGRGVAVHRMLVSWSDEDSWATVGDGGVRADGTTATVDPVDSLGFIPGGTMTQIDVTEAVQAWVDGAPNHGVVLLPENRDGWAIDSAEGATPPMLDVSYVAR